MNSDIGCQCTLLYQCLLICNRTPKGESSDWLAPCPMFYLHCPYSWWIVTACQVASDLNPETKLTSGLLSQITAGMAACRFSSLEAQHELEREVLIREQNWWRKKEARPGRGSKRILMKFSQRLNKSGRNLLELQWPPTLAHASEKAGTWKMFCSVFECELQLKSDEYNMKQDFSLRRCNGE